MDKTTRRKLVGIINGPPDQIIPALECMLAARKSGPARAMRKGPTKAQSKAARDVEERAFYEAAKSAAFGRSGGQCEVVTDGKRCPTVSMLDPDHVLGGAHKKECERLGAAGLRIMCRTHHDMKTANSPTGRFWLDQAREHAIRIGSPRLLGLVDRAITLYEAKHGRVTR